MSNVGKWFIPIDVAAGRPYGQAGGYEIDTEDRFQEYKDNFGETYVLSDQHDPTPIFDEHKNPVRVWDGSQLVDFSDANKLENAKSKAMKTLQIAYQIALNALDNNEPKAKTLLLDALASGDPAPQYWLDWKAGRDAIDANYQTEKAMIAGSGVADIDTLYSMEFDLT